MRIKSIFKDKQWVAVATILLLVTLRGALLELTDLLDPTEARYATVAQQMVLSGDWTTPHLPMSKGITPYLGKPPLHFWLTAISYKLFSVDEWSTRFPSFACALGVLFLTYIYSRKIRRSSISNSLLPSLILFSTPLFFVLMGASVVDMTLTFCATLAIVAFAFFVDSTSAIERRNYSYVYTIALALGFLTKGPVALILFGLPVLTWLFVARRTAVIREIPWFSVIGLFLVLVLPWFVVCEQRNPGFIKYFVWNENVARYFLHNYGDRYGSGHVHPRGYVWLMFFFSFFPWSILLLSWLAQSPNRRELLAQLRRDPWQLYALIWGIAPVVFFTFVRQLHSSYILPGIPGVAMYVAYVMQSPLESFSRRMIRPIIFIIPFCFLAVGIVGYFVSATLFHIFLAYLLLTGGIVLAYWAHRADLQVGHLQACVISAAFLAAIPLASSIIGERKSTALILKKIIETTTDANLVIGVAGTNVYSHFWTANAWEEEVGEPFQVTYVNLRDKHSYIPNDVIIRRDDLGLLPHHFHRNYKEQNSTQRWVWFRKVK